MALLKQRVSQHLDGCNDHAARRNLRSDRVYLTVLGGVITLVAAGVIAIARIVWGLIKNPPTL